MASKKSSTEVQAGTHDQSVTGILLPEGYKPSHDEEFMNPMQLEYFRSKLTDWRAELLQEANQTLENLSSESLHKPDQMDRAQIESSAALDLRTRDRERKSKRLNQHYAALKMALMAIVKILMSLLA